MFRAHRFDLVDDDQDDANRQTASLAGLAFALLLVVIGLFLVHTLRAKAVVEDCLLSGRTNCEQVLVIRPSATLAPLR